MPARMSAPAMSTSRMFAAGPASDMSAERFG